MSDEDVPEEENEWNDSDNEEDARRAAFELERDRYYEELKNDLRQVTLAGLQERQAIYYKLEALTVKDIELTWRNPTDTTERTLEWLDQPNLPYDWRDPICMKMVHRFRNCGKRIAQFYHQIDPGNQQLLLHLHVLTDNDCLVSMLMVRGDRQKDRLHREMTFFAWTSNMLGVGSIGELLEQFPQQAVTVDDWKVAPILFFYSLSLPARQHVLSLYQESLM